MSERIFLGVDGACEEHACAALDEAKQVIWHQQISNDHAGCEPVLEKVEMWQKEGLEVWVGAEGIGGYLSPLDVRLCAAGCKYVNVPALQLKHFREGRSLQPDKDDEKDALLIAEFLREQVQEGRARVQEETDEFFKEMKELSRGFLRITDAKVALQNQLVSTVRTYWPELMKPGCYFSRTDARSLLALLGRYPTPEAVAKAGRHRVNQVLSRASGRDQTELSEKLVENARSVRGLVDVTGVQASVVQRIARGLLDLLDIVQELEKEMEKHLNKHPFGTWLLDQEGIGARTAGCFLGEAGDLNRFGSESKFARYAGNGGIKNQSGKSKERHRDGHRYNHRLKRALLLMAESRSRYHGPSAEYVRTHRLGEDGYWKAVKKLARYLVKFLWKSWEKIVNSPSPTGQEMEQKA